VIIVQVPSLTTAKAAGSRWKLVTCDHCEAQWAWRAQKQTLGWVEAPDYLPGVHQLARQRATDDLAQALAAAIPDVACPSCGRYQRGEVARLRVKRFASLKDLGVVLVVLGLFSALVPAAIYFLPFSKGPPGDGFTIAVIVCGALLIGGVASLIVRKRRMSAFDPNTDASARRGRERDGDPDVLTRERYDALSTDGRARGEEWPALEWSQPRIA
jgi:hypothetical protein